MAGRRYLEFDPSQRLVAGTLERRWNDALLHLAELKKQIAEYRVPSTDLVGPFIYRTGAQPWPRRGQT